MKNLILLIFALLLITGCCEKTSSIYSENVAYAIEQIQFSKGWMDNPEIGGSQVGAAAEPHPIFLLQEYIKRNGTLMDFKNMMKSKHPIVRVVGAQSIISNSSFLFLESELRARHTEEKFNWDELWNKEMNIRKEFIFQYKEDPEVISVGPVGCIFSKSTVGNVVQELYKNPYYFDSVAEQVDGD